MSIASVSGNTVDAESISAIDVGCGSAAERVSAHTIGIDVNLDECPPEKSDHLILGDATSTLTGLAKEGAQVQVVYVDFVLSGLQPDVRRQLLSAASSVLAPDGELRITDYRHVPVHDDAPDTLELESQTVECDPETASQTQKVDAMKRKEYYDQCKLTRTVLRSVMQL